MMVRTHRTTACHWTYSLALAANSRQGTSRAFWRALSFLSSRTLRTRLSKLPLAIHDLSFGGGRRNLRLDSTLPVRASSAKLSFGSFETQVPRDEQFACSESRLRSR